MVRRALIWIIPVLLGIAGAGFEITCGQWRSMPPFRVQATGLYPGGGDFSFQRDDAGLRGFGLAGDVTILTLGGAATEQPYLPDELTWQHLLTSLIRQNGQRGLVVNGGRLGGSLADHQRMVQGWAAKHAMKPRFALILLDDAGLVAHPPERRSPKSRSALYRRWFGDFVDFPADLALPAPPDRLSADGAQAVHQLAQSLLMWGAVPVFVSVPGLGKFNQDVLAQCRRDDLLCLDAARDVDWQPSDTMPGRGFTPAGAAKMAVWLFTRLGILV